MTDRVTSIATVRVLALFGFAVGFQMSVLGTLSHVGNEASGPGHAWYHFFREVGLDIGAIIAILIILFSAPRYRTPLTWSVALVLMIGYYAPFWVGALWMPELAPPGGFGSGADWAHIIQASFVLLALFLGRRHFYSSPAAHAAAHAARAGA